MNPRLKQVTIFILWCLAGACAGIAAATILFPVWDWLGIRQPAADWMLAHGIAHLIVGYWSMVWVYAMDWLALLAGGAIAGLFVRRGFLWKILLFSTGFYLGSICLSLAQGSNPYAITLQMHVLRMWLLWQLPIFVLPPASAFLVATLRKERAAFPEVSTNNL
jgi:hypothetical protein